ncbi:MAG: excinuclease ABC subunit UvrA, partial [Deltaproteobacteria bacterium]|nr:excinuclease ABC subunit UvrA [Deltaproteobacteria bacterium]
MSQKFIIVKGAKAHNLKNIDVKIPREKFVVITGLSGSGKSSLAFDTIYAEGQRRYVESLSAYARQFLEQMAKPDVESIEGLSPAISIEQRNSSRNPRSTVGTSTEIYDYLRVLFARIGKPFCWQCGKPIAAQSVSQIVDQILNYPEGTKIHLFAPVVRGRKGTYQKELQQFQKEGFTRANIDGKLYELSELVGIPTSPRRGREGEAPTALPLEGATLAPMIDKKKKHTIDLLIDRLVIKKEIKTRLTDSVETALRYGNGMVKVECVGKGAGPAAPSLSVSPREPSDRDSASPAPFPTQLFNQSSSCVDCGVSYPEITPQMFSFNNPQGACETCSG